MPFECVMAFVPNIQTSAFGSLADAPWSFDEAIGGKPKNVSVAQAGKHVFVVSRGDLWQVPVLKKEPEGGVNVFFDGDFFELSTFGKNDRLRQFNDGEVNAEDGEPLPEERVFNEIEDPDEAHLEFMCRLAGITQEEFRGLDWYLLTPKWKKLLGRG